MHAVAETNAGTIHHSRPPQSALRGMVSRLWASQPGEHGGQPAIGIEQTLPATEMHLVVRLDDSRVDILAPSGTSSGFRAGAVSGLRTAAYGKRAIAAPTVGAMLRPGACASLLGIPAGEFAGRHVALADIWPSSRLDRLRDRLAGAIDVPAMAAIFEAELLEGSAPHRWVDSPIQTSVALLKRGARVGDVANISGMSHRHFIDQFREKVGITPVRFRGVARIGAVTHALATSSASLAEIALMAGFADQAHMAREFRRFTGLTVTAYRARVGHHPRHVPARPERG
jgi:AraC-like DNA-binding protein